ncbi:hypothetical protein GQ457_16G010300 [Hibiscus cannabinus]
MRNPCGLTASKDSAVGFQGGRPPDGTVCFEESDILERTGSSIPSDVQPLQKKGRRVDDRISDEMMVVDEGVQGDSQSKGESGMARGMGAGDLTMPMLSFRDMLIGDKGNKEISELDVEVGEEDVRVGGSSTLPEISFSDRIHDEINAQLANSVVVCLLGKSIGYRALLSRIQNLWSPSGGMSLIDLDNEYYLVRFTLEEDFQKVVKGGPWVIYGSYLMVQPWSRCFSTKEDHPSQIMAVVRIDYKTTEGKRGHFARLAIMVDLHKPLVSYIIIDGYRQDIEYEGLPVICYKCGKFGHVQEACGKEDVVVENVAAVEEITRDPKDLYGPWMQVVNRGRRPVGSRGFGASNVGRGRRGVLSGSRFAVLEEDMGQAGGTMDAVQVEGESRDQVDETIPVEKVGNTSSGAVAGTMPMRAGSIWRVDVGNGAGSYVAQRQTEGVENDEMRVVEESGQCDMVDFAARGSVVGAKTTLDSGKHVVVRVEERVEGGGAKISKGRIFPNSIRGNTSSTKKGGGVQGGSKLGVKIAKRDERAQANPRLTSCLSTLVADLDKAAAGEKARLTGARIDSSSSMGGKDPTPDPGDGKRGANDPEFNKIFKMLMKDKIPDVAAIFEPRISGMRADIFIRSSGFDRSFRVEANGFSGGIWVLWRDTVSLDILAVSNQFVHCFGKPAAGERGFYVTFVYASLEVGRRRGLWDQLKALAPRQGLIDMGFNGPQYTWGRGGLFQRLDWCLCNQDWYDAFPMSDVFHLPMLGSNHRPIMLSTVVQAGSRGERPFPYVVAWNDHEDFSEMLTKAWDVNKPFYDNVINFQNESRKWNTNVFGHIEKRKRCLLARIKGVERELERSPNSFLEGLDKELKRELDVVLAQEESMWHQKARSSWIENGDQNTRFFHTSVMARRKRNIIQMLRIDGHWCEDVSRL